MSNGKEADSDITLRVTALDFSLRMQANNPLATAKEIFDFLKLGKTPEQPKEP